MTEFIEVLKKGDLPRGTGRRVEVRGEAIALFNVDGKIYAIDDACPHQGASLAEGDLEGTVVVCALHQWRFELATGLGDLDSRLQVRAYPVRVEGEAVYVGL